MTYSYVHRAINREAFPNAVELFDNTMMTGRGHGKYCYRGEARAEGEQFLREQLSQKAKPCANHLCGLKSADLRPFFTTANFKWLDGQDN